MDKRNRKALGFLLAGLSAAGRALLAVPEAASLAELSLTVLAVVGYLVLGRAGLKPLLCGVGQLVLELVLCGAQTETGGAWVWLAPLLRDADLLLLVLASLYLLTLAGEPGRALPALLAALWAVYAVAHCIPSLAGAASVSFVAFSVALLWFTVRMIRAYNQNRARGPR